MGMEVPGAATGSIAKTPIFHGCMVVCGDRAVWIMPSCVGWTAWRMPAEQLVSVSVFPEKISSEKNDLIFKKKTNCYQINSFNSLAS
ncbi:MAG: hypothetical protein ACOY4H_10930 [Thermodesulfobacteriota bacterium]